MKKLLLLLLCMLMIIGTLPAMVSAEDAMRPVFLYVSTEGNDAASGGIEDPFATIIAARDKIRQMKKDGIYPAGGVVVYLRGGDYQINKTLDLTADDSGTAEAPVVYRSYPGEKAVLVGGASIDASKFVPASTSEIAQRVIDEDARKNLLSINLTEQGFGEIGEVYLEGAYSYNAPFPENPGLRSPELFVDGKVMQNSRYPNEGFIKISEVLFDGYSSDGLPGGKTQGDPYAGVEFKSEDTRYLKWDKADDAVVCGFWRFDWADQAMPIKAIDKEKGTITTTLSSRYGTNRGQKFYAYNLPEEIDIPGEYYIDRKNNVLYMYPPKGFSVDSTVRLSYMKDNLITISGASYIDIQELTFTAMRKSAVYIWSGNEVCIKDCEFEYSADYCVYIANGTNCGVKNSYIHDVNGGIMLFGGNSEKLIPGNNYVENCEIERFSRLTKTYKPAVYGGGVQNRISHNEIHDAPHLGIMFGGFDMLIDYNEIYNVVSEADDMGAIYGGQSWLGRGLVIKNNYIHDIVSKSSGSTGISAVYLDGCQCDVTMEGNIVENVGGDAFKINGGRDNVVKNNIAINCKSNVLLCLVPDSYSYETRINTIIKSSIWSNPEEEPWKKEPFASRYPEMMAMLEDEPMLPKDNSMINNVSVNTEPERYIYIDYEDPMEIKGNYSTYKDPGFVDMMRKNYNLKEDSIVYKEIPDFVPIKFSEIGRYDKRAIKKTKDAVVLSVGSPYAVSNYKKTLIDSDNMNVTPVILNSKTYVPVRFVAEAFGMEVAYNGGNIILSSEETEVKMNVGSTAATLNGESQTLQSAPVIDNDRTLVPLRDVSNLLGKKVFWDNSGFIAISDSDNLFDSQSDEKLISYLNDYLSIH